MEVFSYDSNVEHLESELEKLKLTRDDVEMVVYEAQKKSEIISPDVKDWLRHVEEIEKESAEILGYDVLSLADVKCFKWKCPNKMVRYWLSRRAAKTVQFVIQLQVKGHVVTVTNPSPEGLKKAAVSNSRQRSIPSRSSIEQAIMDALKGDVINVIGICGITGVGKTTMAKEAASRARSEANIDDVIVLQNTDLREIEHQLAVILDLRMTVEEEEDSHARAQCLCERLTCGKRTLVLLDDVKEAIDLEKLGIPFGDSNCKVLVTSQLESICNDMGTHKNFAVDVLSDQEAWDLFKDIIGDFVNHDKELLDMAEDIVQGCGRLPLEIVTTGTRLSHGRMRDWDDALARLTHSTSKVPGKGNKISFDEALQQLRNSTVINNSQSQREACSKIKSSYNNLKSAEAKSLFLLCCQLPEDEFISIEMLFRYGQGLQGFEESETLESTRKKVYSMVGELKGCGLLVEDGESLVKVEDNERHVGKSIASKDENAMHAVRCGSGMKECRYNDKYQPYTTISLHSNEMHELRARLHSAKVNLLWLAYSHHEGIEISADSFEGMEELKLLHVRANFVKPLPLSLKFMKNLQTLSLDFCSLLVDVSFIGDLKNLEILSFFHSKLDVLPSQIRELSKLKLLDLRCSLGPSIIPSGVLSRLKKLEELYTGHYFGVTNVEIPQKRNSANVKELNLLSQLKVLQISVVLDDEILRKLEKFPFDKLIGFDFSTFERKLLLFPPHQFSKIVALQRVLMSDVLKKDIKELMRKAEKLSLRSMKTLKNRVELNKEVFAKLNRLCMSNCGGVEELVSDSDGDSAIANLESLEILGMPDLKGISSRNLPEGSFGRLHELNLERLPKMMYLWRGHVELSSLGNLRILKMHDCGAIESIFSRSMVKCLLQLQQVMVTQCGNLKEVVSKEREEGFETIKFPKLKELMLSNLQNFRSFYLSTQSLLNRQVSLPNLEILDVSDVCGLSSYVRIVADGMQAKLLHNLRVLRVSNCKSAEAIFDLKLYKHRGELDEVMPGEVMLGQLESIKLCDLPNLTHIWRRVPEGRQGFHNLRSLEVTGCNSMTSLLLPSTAKMVVNLQELKLAKCEMMRQVIEMEEDQEEESSKVEMMDKMVIPQLRSLELKDMKNLAFFWYGECDFELPLLESVFISNCPEMVTFYSGRPLAPNLVRAQTCHRNANEWIWKGDLNSTVAYLSKRTKDDEDI